MEEEASLVLYVTVLISLFSVLSHVLLRHNDVLKVQPLPDEDVVEWMLKKLECLDLTFLTNFILKLYNRN